MGDFDLSQALEGPLNVVGFEPSCFDMMTSQHVQDDIIRLGEGLDLVVTRYPINMKAVAHLVVAVNRIKKLQPAASQELSDGELCRIIDSIVEETIVKTVVDYSTGQRKFHRMKSENEFILFDSSQKALVCTSEEFKLQAITLKGGYCDFKAQFKLRRYVTVSPPAASLIVLLSIANNLHISCFMDGDTAALNLEECSEERLKAISDEELERFLFYKTTSGKTLTSFESVKCRGWFISTSSEKDNQPVEMCKVDTAYRLTNFKMI